MGAVALHVSTCRGASRAECDIGQWVTSSTYVMPDSASNPSRDVALRPVVVQRLSRVGAPTAGHCAQGISSAGPHTPTFAVLRTSFSSRC